MLLLNVAAPLFLLFTSTAATHHFRGLGDGPDNIFIPWFMVEHEGHRPPSQRMERSSLDLQIKPGQESSKITSKDVSKQEGEGGIRQ